MGHSDAVLQTFFTLFQKALDLDPPIRDCLSYCYTFDVGNPFFFTILFYCFFQ